MSHILLDQELGQCFKISSEKLMVSIVMTLDIFAATIRFNFDIYLDFINVMHNKGSPVSCRQKLTDFNISLISEARRGSEWNIEWLHLSSKHYRSSFICKLAILNWQWLAQAVNKIRVTKTAAGEEYPPPSCSIEYCCSNRLILNLLSW